MGAACFATPYHSASSTVPVRTHTARVRSFPRAVSYVLVLLPSVPVVGLFCRPLQRCRSVDFRCVTGGWVELATPGSRSAWNVPPSFKDACICGTLDRGHGAIRRQREERLGLPSDRAASCDSVEKGEVCVGTCACTCGPRRRHGVSAHGPGPSELGARGDRGGADALLVLPPPEARPRRTGVVEAAAATRGRFPAQLPALLVVGPKGRRGRRRCGA